MPILRWTLALLGFFIFMACSMESQREEVDTYGYAPRDSLIGRPWHGVGIGNEIEFRKDSTFLERAVLRNAANISVPSWVVGSLTLAGHWHFESGLNLRMQLDSCGGSDYLPHSCDSLVAYSRPILGASPKERDAISLASATGDSLRVEIMEYYECLEEEGDWMTVCYRRAEKPYRYELLVYGSADRSQAPKKYSRSK